MPNMTLILNVPLEQELYDEIPIRAGFLDDLGQEFLDEHPDVQVQVTVATILALEEEAKGLRTSLRPRS